MQGILMSELGTGLKWLLQLYIIGQIAKIIQIQGVGKHAPPLMGGAAKSHCKGAWG